MSDLHAFVSILLTTTPFEWVMRAMYAMIAFLLGFATAALLAEIADRRHERSGYQPTGTHNTKPTTKPPKAP